MIVGWLIFVEFIVMFSSSKDNTPADTPNTRPPFFQMASLAQQICILGPPLGRAVQAASESMKTSFSLSVPGGKKMPGKFNFGVGRGGGGG